jgi:hypothetical protein
MIVHWVMVAIADFVSAIGSLLTVPSPPAFLSSLPGWIGTVGGYVANTGVWLPWSLAAAVGSAYAAILGVGLAIKLVRIAASFVTLGGGSAS